MDGLLYFGYFLLRRAPILLLVLGGIVFALIRWKRHPKVSLIALAGLGFFLIESLIYTIALYRLPSLFERMGLDYSSNQLIYTVLYVLDDIAYAIVIVLLVIAAFLQRHVQPASKAL